MSDPVEDGKAAIVTEIVRAAASDPVVKEAGSQLARAGLTLAKTVNTVLLPLAAVNYTIEKAREYFAERFQADIAEAAKSIPPDSIVEPKASIAGPALQGLAFSHEEPELRQMYAKLLATAMDGRSPTLAHPAFVEVIKQITAEEARLLAAILPVHSIPVVSVVAIEKANRRAFIQRSRHIIDLRADQGKGEPVVISNVEAMMNNFIRLGLIEADYDRQIAATNACEWAESRPEVRRERESTLPATHEIDIVRGIVFTTAFGAQFARAIGIGATGATAAAT